MTEDAAALNYHVIGFNYRGVSKSTGQAKSKDDLVTDGITPSRTKGVHGTGVDADDRGVI
jgi:hypothetical protein